MQQVARDQLVHLEFELRDDGGAILEATSEGEPMRYVHGHGDLAPGLESHLEGKREGDAFEVTLDPAAGFGERDEARVLEIDRSEFGSEIQPEVGLQLHMQTQDGSTLPVTIVEVKADTVVLDGNHVFAGKSLHFKGKVVGVRKANADELRGCCGQCDV